MYMIKTSKITEAIRELEDTLSPHLHENIQKELHEELVYIRAQMKTAARKAINKQKALLEV